MLLLIGLYMRLEPAEVQATEPEEVQVTGESPTQPSEAPQGVPIDSQCRSLQQLWNRLLNLKASSFPLTNNFGKPSTLKTSTRMSLRWYFESFKLPRGQQASSATDSVDE